MAAKNQNAAKRKIQKLNLNPCINLLIKYGELRTSCAKQAQAEYRQFLLLLWLRKHNGDSDLLIPSDLALTVWIQHLDFKKAYADFSDDLLGEYTDLIQGINDDSLQYSEAVIRTAGLHKSLGETGFVDRYLALEVKNAQVILTASQAEVLYEPADNAPEISFAT